MTKHLITRVLLGLAVATVGTGAAQTDWKYTALGDSIATGYAAQAGYVTRYHGYLETDNAVTATLYNLAQNGATSGRLLTMLQSDSVVQNAVSAADVLTWNIGLNDYQSARTSYKRKKCGGKDNQDCLRQMVSTFRSNWNASVIEILNRRSIATTAIRTMDIYNPWVGADRTANTTADRSEIGPARGTDLQVLKYYLDQMNTDIALGADANGIPCAQVYALFNGPDGTADPAAAGYLTTDGLHPSEAGHEAIADLLRGLTYVPFR